MVLQKFKISNELAKITLIDILAFQLDISKKKAKGLLDTHSVFVNGKRIWMAKAKLRPGDEVEVQLEEEAKRGKGFSDKLSILHQDESIIIINKPSGIESIGEKGVEGRLAAQLGVPAIFACHRLDRDTSGCFVVAKSEEIAKAMEAHFRARAVNKVYLALAEGELTDHDFMVDQRLDGKEASTRFIVAGRGRGGVFLDVRPVTGRTHQIRRHLQTVGARLLGERNYLGKIKASEAMRLTRRQMLHAHKLDMPSLKDASRRLKISAPIPADFMEAAGRLGIKFSDLKRYVTTAKSDRNAS